MNKEITRRVVANKYQRKEVERQVYHPPPGTTKQNSTVEVITTHIIKKPQPKK